MHEKARKMLDKMREISREHRRVPKHSKTVYGMEPIGSALRDSDLIREPSWLELAKRHPVIKKTD